MTILDKYDGIAVVIPVLNEREGIERVLKELIALGIPKDRILVVDGHSTDGTPQIVMNMGIRVVFQNGKGKADAVKKGVEEILKSLRDVEYVVFLDGDCTYPPSFIPAFLKKALEGYDFIVGWRKYVEKGAQNIVYKLGNWLLTKVFNILFGCKLHDVLSGMYLAKASVLREIDYEFKGFSIESEIIAHIVSSGYKVAEIPITYRKRCGEKKLKPVHGLKIFLDIIRLTWRHNPAFLTFLIGSMMLIPGLILGAYVAYHYFFEGVKYHVKGLIAIILTVAGFQSLIVAMLSLYLKRFELRLYKKLREKSSR